jgi:hypothetical protein
MRKTLAIVITLMVCVWGAATAHAQTPAAAVPATVRVFLDCNACDFDFLRQEIKYLDYVRDRKDADVHVLVTTLDTGSRGREYALQYIGLGAFDGLTFKSTYISGGTDTDDERRRGFARAFTLGLGPYLQRTAAASRLRIQYSEPDEDAKAAGGPVKDKWNLWVFRLGGSIDVSGEESDKSREFNGSFSANRVSDQWIFRIYGEGEHNKNTFTLSDDRDINSLSHYYEFGATAIKSLGKGTKQHWAALGRLSTNENTRENNAQKTLAAAGVEYSVFPYDQSTQRTFVLQWAAGIEDYRYFERTIYDKLKETRPLQSLKAVLALRQQWGSSTLSIEHVNYLDDFKKRRLELDGNIDIRLFRGLNLEMGGEASIVRDQIYLPAGKASDEEILLRRRSLETGYRYEFSIGFSYQFGSIFNNVVNPRWNR